MQTQMKESLTVKELEMKKAGLVERIQHLEADLSCPLESNLDDQAAQISNHVIIKRLLEIERTYLEKLNCELDLHALIN